MTAACWGSPTSCTGLRRTAVVPAGVVAQCWRASPRQHAIRRLLNSRSVTIEPMTEAMAFAIGVSWRDRPHLDLVVVV